MTKNPSNKKSWFSRLFSFTQEIAMDLGTANSIIIHNDKIVVDEPSVVAIENKTDRLRAVGTEAHMKARSRRACAPCARCATASSPTSRPPRP